KMPKQEPLEEQLRKIKIIDSPASQESLEKTLGKIKTEKPEQEEAWMKKEIPKEFAVFKALKRKESEKKAAPEPETPKPKTDYKKPSDIQTKLKETPKPELPKPTIDYKKPQKPTEDSNISAIIKVASEDLVKLKERKQTKELPSTTYKSEEKPSDEEIPLTVKALATVALSLAITWGFLHYQWKALDYIFGIDSSKRKTEISAPEEIQATYSIDDKIRGDKYFKIMNDKLIIPTRLDGIGIAFSKKDAKGYKRVDTINLGEIGTVDSGKNIDSEELADVLKEFNLKSQQEAYQRAFDYALSHGADYMRVITTKSSQGNKRSLKAHAEIYRGVSSR
ncbi:hypothetical protein GOV06_01465, partial [Candidatus Woesearchaeota archaeon]|nr:hypothetical protein [Candidatus Woesearchaeota archaeon]